jgi:hypothetical protein
MAGVARAARNYIRRSAVRPNHSLNRTRGGGPVSSNVDMTFAVKASSFLVVSGVGPLVVGSEMCGVPVQWIDGGSC